MKVPTNKIKDIIRYYSAQLIPLYGEDETKQVLGMLIEHFFGYDRMALALNPDMRLSESEMLAIHFAVKDLLKNKPIQYIIGETFFGGNKFEVNKNVLIPRPETEELVDIASKYLQENPQAISILDIGTGSGCIAISLALRHKNAKVVAIDVSDTALEVAVGNSKKLAAELDFFQMDICTPLAEVDALRFDMIISNPPYVTEADKTKMSSNVIDWEPDIALFAPENDPLFFYRQIINFANFHLNDHGILLLELNETFGNEVLELFEKNNYTNTKLLTDIHGKARFASGIQGPMK